MAASTSIAPQFTPDSNVPTKSDDSVLAKKIVETHDPNGLEYDVKPFLHLFEDIFKLSSSDSEDVFTGTSAHVEHVEGKDQHPGYTNMLETVSSNVDRIACELSYKSHGGSNAHSATVSVFDMLTKYRWDVKLVLTLASFAHAYGDFWLLSHIHATSQLAKSGVILKQVPRILELEGQLKPWFGAINDLLGIMLEVTSCVIEFIDLPDSYIGPEVLDYDAASSCIPIATYWTVRGIVVCATQITSHATMDSEFTASTTEAWELSTLAQKLKTIVADLRKHLDNCNRYIEKKKYDEAYESLCQLFRMAHADNMEVLKALISAEDDILSLVECSTKKRVSLDALRSKNVLLLISGLDLLHDEVILLEYLFNLAMENLQSKSQFELVWLPIVDRPSTEWTDAMQRKFESLQTSMPWYSVCHPSLIRKAVVQFVQREWKYKNEPILVALDPQGAVACPDAIPMMWTWANLAFPFTIEREKALWREWTWGLTLLGAGFHTDVQDCINKGGYIFVYGGGDIEWVKKFVREARRVSLAAHIPLEMLYVGQSNAREQVKRVYDAIRREELETFFWTEQIAMTYFWKRLERMLFTKIQSSQANDQDLMTQQIKKVLSYDKQDGMFVFAKGDNIVTTGHANIGLQTLIDYDNIWKHHADKEGFEIAFGRHYRKLHEVANPCCRLEFSYTEGKIPKKLRCPECQRRIKMKILATFQCSHDEDVDDSGSENEPCDQL